VAYDIRVSKKMTAVVIDNFLYMKCFIKDPSEGVWSIEERTRCNQIDTILFKGACVN
jgi:hypothetical protein